MAESIDLLRAGLGRGAISSVEPGTLLAAWDALLGDEAVGPESRSAMLDGALEETSRPAFLTRLDPAQRDRWVDLALRTIRIRDHRLADLLAWRAREHPERALFRELHSPSAGAWTYRAVHRRAREFAATIMELQGRNARPRVALWTSNSVNAAIVDLACLSYDILVVPLGTHVESGDVEWILERLGVEILIADGDERIQRACRLRDRRLTQLKVVALDRRARHVEVPILGELAAKLAPADVERILALRSRIGIDDPATVMFTSGSTGRPKGVVFSPMNIIAKRYCRAAAVPQIGEDEVFLCYLPLFHTFGRFLEMLGTIFWRGTYVFVGNPSFETLRAGLSTVRPTVMISVPMRWQQLRASVLGDGEKTAEEEAGAFQRLTGGRLRWGLSAAGHLEPKVFRFFHRHGVDLCSGFGMTEGTGGITMSPPGDYVDETVGRPLPGIHVDLDENGEMRIAGPYVARYLREDGHDLDCESGELRDGLEWLRTGDVFRELGDGHLQIVDRVKDIYKNSRGQTIAPRRAEDQFQGVPGIRRVYLVGDHRPHNVLLVVADENDPVMRDAPDAHARHEYLGRIIAAANQRLAPFERIVDFALLDRDFEETRGELTPKGSYRRKTVEENFARVIDELYHSPAVELRMGAIDVRLPHWLVRDLGGLAQDFRIEGESLVDRRRATSLCIRPNPRRGTVVIGDLEYALDGTVVDLGRLCRQPGLWMGNSALLRFCPGRDGWDVDPEPFSERVWRIEDSPVIDDFDAVDPQRDSDPELVRVDRLVQILLHTSAERALPVIEDLSHVMGRSDERLSRAVRYRLTALAEHPDESVRCEAYRVLLLDEPTSVYHEAFGAFVESGKTFLNAKTIEKITAIRFGTRRLHALRHRLSLYREELEWPASDLVRGQFEAILELLADYAREFPEHYHPVRCELATWALHDVDPALAASTQRKLSSLVRSYEERLQETSAQAGTLRAEQVVFDDDISEEHRSRQWRLLSETPFLVQSIRLAFADSRFETTKIPRNGLWISALASTPGAGFYRWSLRTVDGHHHSLLVVVRDDLDAARVLQTNYWMLAIGAHPSGPRRIPRFGCSRPELGAMSLEFVEDLTVAERLREAAANLRGGGESPEPGWWRQILVSAMATFFEVWRMSGRRIVPGSIRPENVAVPEPDYLEANRVLSLTGWFPYAHASDLFVLLHEGFYERVAAHQPECAAFLRERWIAEACTEALGTEEAVALLTEFLDGEDREHPWPTALAQSIRDYLTDRGHAAHVPLVVEKAVLRFQRWKTANDEATLDAQCEQIDALIQLYRMESLGESWRYHLYRHTAFEGAPEEIQDAFDRLLDALRTGDNVLSTQRVELSELQAAIGENELRLVLARAVFPRSRAHADLDVLTYGEPGHEQVVVRTKVTDRSGESYDVREPIGPEEVGQVYRLFYREHFARSASEADHFLVALDRDERVVAAVIHRPERQGVAHMDGIVVRSSLWGRGIATVLLDELCHRLSGHGIEVLRTNFILRRFCERRGFRLDRRWGGLVRFLAESGVSSPSG